METDRELQMRLLVIEDDNKIAEFVCKGFREAGFAVDHADDGVDGLHLLLTEEYDAAIVDLMLPGIDGIRILKKARDTGKKTPVIVLSAKRELDDRIKGLECGADDYLTKPFSFTELLARVNALLRRAASIAEPTALSVGNLTVDLLSRTVHRGEEPLDLQPKEFALLRFLLQNRGKVVSKVAILEHIWDYQFDPQTNVVDVLVSRLRKKVDRDHDTKLIHTLRGVGYVLKDA